MSILNYCYVYNRLLKVSSYVYISLSDYCYVYTRLLLCLYQPTVISISAYCNIYTNQLLCLKIIYCYVFSIRLLLCLNKTLLCLYQQLICMYQTIDMPIPDGAMSFPIICMNIPRFCYVSIVYFYAYTILMLCLLSTLLLCLYQRAGISMPKSDYNVYLHTILLLCAYQTSVMSLQDYCHVYIKLLLLPLLTGVQRNIAPFCY
jgi:hypothetical protein